MKIFGAYPGGSVLGGERWREVETRMPADPMMLGSSSPLCASQDSHPLAILVDPSPLARFIRAKQQQERPREANRPWSGRRRCGNSNVGERDALWA